MIRKNTSFEQATKDKPNWIMITKTLVWNKLPRDLHREDTACTIEKLVRSIHSSRQFM
jgi:hypothetical protein